MADPTRDAETVTPAADAAPAASVVVDGLPPENRTAGIVPDVPIAPPEAVVAGEPVPTTPRRSAASGRCSRAARASSSSASC